MIKSRPAPCLWFAEEAEEAAPVLYGDLQELAHHGDHAVRQGGFRGRWCSSWTGSRLRR